MSRNQSQANYEDVDVLRDADGVVCVITKKKGTTFFSFCFCKEFERDGQTIRTNFLSRRHTEAIRRLTLKVEEWIDREIDRATASRASGG